MKNPSSRRTASRISLRKAGIALGLTCALFAGVSQAQVGVLVTDPAVEEASQGTQTSAAASVAKQIDQYIKQGQQYLTQVQQYEQMLTSAENLGMNVSLVPNTLQPITDTDSMIQQNCNGGSSSGFGDILNSVVSLFSQPISQSQQAICGKVVELQVDKYNKTVDMLNQLQTYNGSLQKLSNMANTFDNMGKSSSTTTQATTYTSQLTTAMNNWQTQMQADDTMISALRDQQSMLAKMAMDSKPDFLGQGTQAAALTLAFSVDK